MTMTILAVLLLCVGVVAFAALMKAMDALDRVYFAEMALRDERPRTVKECSCGCGRNVYIGKPEHRSRKREAQPQRVVK